jgi:hypothetical protein
MGPILLPDVALEVTVAKTAAGAVLAKLEEKVPLLES